MELIPLLLYLPRCIRSTHAKKHSRSPVAGVAEQALVTVLSNMYLSVACIFLV